MLKKLLVFWIVILGITKLSIAQNVGVGTTIPTHSLHVVPNAGIEPLRVQGLQLYVSEQNFLVVDPASGVVRYMHWIVLLQIIEIV